MSPFAAPATAGGCILVCVYHTQGKVIASDVYTESVSGLEPRAGSISSIRV